MSRDQAMDTGPEWIREEWEDFVSWWGVRKKGLGWRVPLKILQEERSLNLGPAFLRNGGRWLHCGLSRQAEHEFGAHQSRGTCN